MFDGPPPQSQIPTKYKNHWFNVGPVSNINTALGFGMRTPGIASVVLDPHLAVRGRGGGAPLLDLAVRATPTPF